MTPLHSECFDATLPRPVKLGFGAAIDARDFFDIADMIEAALQGLPL